MTQTLQQLLHERADAHEFAIPDLDALVDAGRRRVRRRRLGTGAAALATVAVLGVAVLPGLGDDDGTGRDLVTDGLSTSQVSYARGSVLHVGSTTIEVGHPVRAYVRTAVGYVVADPGGAVWSVTEGGTTRVGSIDARAPHLVSDTDGTVAGWLDPQTGPTFLDQATGRVGEPLLGGGAGPGSTAVQELYAVDGRTAYWRLGQDRVAVDLDTGDRRTLDLPGLEEGGGSGQVVDVEHGRIAVRVDEGTRVGPVGSPGVLLAEAYGEVGDLSPSGRWHSQDADEPMVFDTRDGSRVSLDLGYAFGAGFEWLDDETLVLIAQRDPKAPVELVSCTVPAGECQVAVELAASFDDLAGDIALPVGRALEG